MFVYVLIIYPCVTWALRKVEKEKLERSERIMIQTIQETEAERLGCLGFLSNKNRVFSIDNISSFSGSDAVWTTIREPFMNGSQGLLVKDRVFF